MNVNLYLLKISKRQNSSKRLMFGTAVDQNANKTENQMILSMVHGNRK